MQVGHDGSPMIGLENRIHDFFKVRSLPRMSKLKQCIDFKEIVVADVGVTRNPIRCRQLASIFYGLLQIPLEISWSLKIFLLEFSKW